MHRIPVLIKTNSDQEAEDLINNLSSLIPFRTPLIYYTDFVETQDYIDLLENEESDFDTQRSIFLCYPFAIDKALEKITIFNSWLLGISLESDQGYQKIKNILYEKQKYYLFIEFDKGCLKTQIEGKIFPNLKLDFEKNLYQNTITNTEIAIERMKRVISKRVDSRKIPPEVMENIMNFSIEERELQINMIKKTIINFHQACRRAFNILNRLKNLESYGLKTQISSKTLYNTVAYNEASIERILSFIDAEWNSNYSTFLEIKKISDFADTFESLWG
jgi:hypothetical protein